MGVFDGSVKVPRAVPDPKTDNQLPAPGALSWGGIKTVGGLAGTTGIDCKLVHGNCWQQIVGDDTGHVQGNLSATIGMNRTIKVAADHKETIAGSSTETIIGPHMITNLNTFNETRIGAHIQLHGGIEWVHDKETEFHYGGLNCVFYANVHEMEIDHYELALGHFEVKGQHNYFSVNDNNAVLFQFQTKALNAEVDTTEADIHGLKCEVLSLGSRCGMLEADMVPLKANGGARVGLDSPFGG